MFVCLSVRGPFVGMLSMDHRPSTSMGIIWGVQDFHGVSMEIQGGHMGWGLSGRTGLSGWVVTGKGPKSPPMARRAHSLPLPCASSLLLVLFL